MEMDTDKVICPNCGHRGAYKIEYGILRSGVADERRPYGEYLCLHCDSFAGVYTEDPIPRGLLEAERIKDTRMELDAYNHNEQQDAGYDPAAVVLSNTVKAGCLVTATLLLIGIGFCLSALLWQLFT